MVGHSEPFLHPCLATSFAIAFHTTKGIGREHGLVSCVCSLGVHTPPARRNNCNFIDMAGIGTIVYGWYSAFFQNITGIWMSECGAVGFSCRVHVDTYLWRLLSWLGQDHLGNG